MGEVMEDMEAVMEVAMEDLEDMVEDTEVVTVVDVEGMEDSEVVTEGSEVATEGSEVATEDPEADTMAKLISTPFTPHTATNKNYAHTQYNISAKNMSCNLLSGKYKAVFIVNKAKKKKKKKKKKKSTRVDTTA